MIMPKAFELSMLPVLLLFSATVMSCAWTATRSIHSVLPHSLGEWTAEGADEHYHRDTLFKYINGGAELYLTYGFTEVFVRRYADRSDSDINLEIYDMGSSADAFGIFSIEREDETIGVGQDSEFGGGLLRFWKDRFFVSILATGDVEEAESAMVALAKTVDRFLESVGARPDMVDMLPRDGLVEDSIRFFHTVDILNRQYFFSEENLLHLDRQTDCLLAEYSGGRGNAHLLVIRYADSQSAIAAYDTFLRVYMPEAGNAGAAQLENGAWTLAQRNGVFLSIVMDASDQDLGAKLLADVQR